MNTYTTKTQRHINFTKNKKNKKTYFTKNAESKNQVSICHFEISDFEIQHPKSPYIHTHLYVYMSNRNEYIYH